MDGLTILASLLAAAAAFAAAMALQGSLGATERAVQRRTIERNPMTSAGGTLVVSRLPVLSSRGRRIAFDLERAGLAFSVTEYILLRAGTGLGLAVAALFLSSSLGVSSILGVVFTGLGFLVGYWLPSQYLARRRSKRLRAIEDQLLEVLVSIAKSLRAGMGLTQALDYAGRDTPDPLGTELRRAVREIQLGADIEVIFEEMNGRVGSPDLRIATTAIIIQRRVGGNLSEVLNNVSNTIRERRTIQRELNAITAKARLQGNISAMIPVFVAVFFFLLNTKTASLMFTTTAGNIALGAGIFFELLGLWLVRRLSVIDV